MAISVIRGMDNECVTFTSRFGEPVEKAYIDAVQQGYLPEGTLDTALIRLFTARVKLGMFDPAGHGSLCGDRRERAGQH